MEKCSKLELLNFAKDGLSQKDIMEKMKIHSTSIFYHMSKMTFNDSPGEYEAFRKKLIKNKHVTQKLNNPSPFTISELNDLIKEGYTKQDIMLQYAIANRQTFQNIIIKLHNYDKDQYTIVQEKLIQNLLKKVLEMSKNLTLEEILTTYHLKKNSFYQILRRTFLNIETYHDYKSKLNENLSKQKKDTTNTLKEKKKTDDSLSESVPVSPSPANLDNTKKLDIYHLSYLISKENNGLQDIVSNGNMILIPNLVIQNMLNKKTKYYSLLNAISSLKNIYSDSFLEEDLFSFYTTKAVNEHDYYTKLSLYFMRKGYQITLYCNDIPLLIDCLLLGIPVVHNVTYQYLKEGEKLLVPNLQTEYYYAYDTCYLKDTKVDLTTQQHKLICECVLEELNKIGAQNVIYYIIDTYQKPNTNLHIIPTCSSYSRYIRYRENDNNILDYLQKYELETGHKVKIYTKDHIFHWEALSLNFKTDQILDIKEPVADTSKVSDTALEKKESLTETTDTSTIAITEYNKKHFIVKENVKKVTYDLKGNNLVPTENLGETKYYKVTIGNYVHAKDNKVYKIIHYKLRNNLEKVLS